jgi:acyl carrier protein
MSPEQIRQQVLLALHSIAPEVQASELRTDRPLRDEVDLDSMDWLRFISAVHQRLGVNIPETDYPQIASLDSLLVYLGARLSIEENAPSQTG